MTIDETLAEVGRLYLENIALRRENTALRDIVAAQAKGESVVTLAQAEEATTVVLGPSGDDPAGQPAAAE